MKCPLALKLVVFAILVSTLTVEVNGAKILSIFGYPGPSQYIMASAILKSLAERGHEVTSISTFPQRTPIRNFRDIAVMKNAKMFDAMMADVFGEEAKEKNFFQEILEFRDLSVEMVTNVLEDSKVKDIMANEKFDLIIVETLLCDALYGLGQHFNAPLVGVSTFGTINFIDILVGNISPLSYIPHMSLAYGNRMSVKERLINMITSLIDDMMSNLFILPAQEKLFYKYFPSSQQTFEEVRKSFSLILLNQHFTLSFPRPYVPNMIEVAGLHVKEKPDPLPQDLQNILENATAGAIYFSMGSNLKSAAIPVETLNIFLETFKELKLKVLWKFENESLANKPDNVFIKSWYPQPSILAHRNVKLFISHGGFLSTIETIFHGKPILGIPIFGDQPMNVKNAVRAGYALSLKLKEITKDSFKSTIMELLTNDRYGKKAEKLSKLFRDKPLTPLETAIYWIEYVLRHDGAGHMRNAGMHLSYWQLNNIDVFAILAGISLFTLIVLIVFCRLLAKILFGLKPPKKILAGKTKVKRN